MRGPCADCPFAGKTLDEKREAQEPGEWPQPIMLCHESQCLGGDEPDLPCVGFYQKAEES